MASMFPPILKMWSSEFTGRTSVFNDQQRLLFPVRDGDANTKKMLQRALERSTCTGIALLKPNDRGALQAVRQALDTMYAKLPHLKHDNYAVAVTTGAEWTPENLHARIRELLAALRVENIDLLLLSLPKHGTTSSTAARKRVILSHWEAMCAVKRLGAVRSIGVNDFLIQEMEFIFTAFKAEPPTVVSINVGIASTSPTSQSVSFRSMLSFAQGKHMDVIVRFAVSSINELPVSSPVRELWRQTVEGIAQRHRAKTFDITVVHEAEQEPYHLEKRGMNETNALQSEMQVLLRYFLTRGVVVVPLPDTQDGAATHFSEDVVYDIFYTLVHPFTNAAPTHSPQIQYSSILSPGDVQCVESVLPLVIQPPSSW